jgi:hypothetical protein
MSRLLSLMFSFLSARRDGFEIDSIIAFVFLRADDGNVSMCFLFFSLIARACVYVYLHIFKNRRRPARLADVRSGEPRDFTVSRAVALVQREFEGGFQVHGETRAFVLFWICRDFVGRRRRVRDCPVALVGRRGMESVRGVDEQTHRRGGELRGRGERFERESESIRRRVSRG